MAPLERIGTPETQCCRVSRGIGVPPGVKSIGHPGLGERILMGERTAFGSCSAREVFQFPSPATLWLKCEQDAVHA